MATGVCGWWCIDDDDALQTILSRMDVSDGGVSVLVYLYETCKVSSQAHKTK